MSLFYTNRDYRDVQMKNKRKRKRDTSPKGEDIVIQTLYSCSWCSDEYDSETELHVHKKLKHQKQVNKMLTEQDVCKMCVTRHETEDKLVKHIKHEHLLSSEDAEHVQRQIYICDLCSQMYFNKNMIECHMQYSHSPELKHKLHGICPRCNKMIQIKHIWFHFQRHNIQSLSCCPICLNKNKDKVELQEHLKTHPRLYQCTICGYDTKVKENFTAHMQTHNSNLHLSPNIAIDENLLYRCFAPRNHCNRSDNYGMRGLRLSNLYVCVLCRGLCTEAEKAAHIAQYHLVDLVATKKQYLCVCGEQFFNNVLLKHHVFKMKGDHKACD